MATTSPAQDTTGVTLPAGISFAAVRQIVAELQATEPANRERIGRAVNVLLTSTIRELPILGEYAVQSCAARDTWYTATTWACDCPDHQRHPDLRCKHSVALQVLSVASAIARFERCQTRYLLTAKGEAAVAGLATINEPA
ncbi:MAG TPA: hypothetical protein VII06_33370 [Chloroflexota bacterium]|jgi:hypothetical protein